MVHGESGERLAMNPMKKPPEHAVIVHIPLSDGSVTVWTLKPLSISSRQVPNPAHDSMQR